MKVEPKILDGSTPQRLCQSFLVPGLKSEALPPAATALRFEWNPITLQSGPHVERIS